MYVPARLGPLPPETAGVLDKWGIEPPMVINNLFARVSDVMTPESSPFRPTPRSSKPAAFCASTTSRRVVVTNEDGTYQGLVSTRMIANRYISATDVLETEGATDMSVASDLISSLDEKVEVVMETRS